MRITWWGYACFSVSDGKTVVIDPHDGDSLGLPAPSVEADIILSTHGHAAHSSVESVEDHEKVPVVSGETGDLAVRGLEIRGLESPHGGNGGENTVLRFLLDGIYFCHLGDLGRALTEEEVEVLAPVDVLFVPVGGGCALGPEEAWRCVKALEPSLVFPMHYSVPGLRKDLGQVDDFLDLSEVPVERPGRSYSFTAPPSEPRVVVLEPPE